MLAQVREKRVPLVIEDIYDGMEYQKHLEFTSNRWNMTLIWNTDRLSPFKSSNTTIWPIYLVVNKLPHLGERYLFSFKFMSNSTDSNSAILSLQVSISEMKNHR
jgi:hypothetical protein